MAIFGVTPWSAVSNIIQDTGSDTAFTRAPWEGRALVVVLAIALGSLVTYWFKGWYHQGGLVTSAQATEAQSDPNSRPRFFGEAAAEIIRISRQQPAGAVYHPDSPKPGLVRSEVAPDQLSFRDMVREAFVLKRPDTIINADQDWRDRCKSWIGTDIYTKENVILFCPGREFDQQEADDVFNYLETLGNIDKQKAELVHIRRTLEETPISTNRPGWRITHNLIDNLLTELVKDKLTDYKATIFRRVMADKLPNSDITIAQTYTPSLIHVGSRQSTPEGLWKYFSEWMKTDRQQHAVLLGEYGQGKSTSALVLTYRLLFRSSPGARIPILIELRGKSPKNQDPFDMLSEWGGRNKLAPQTLMLLHRTGRLLLIFDGFDEMDGMGEQRNRHSHFESLWAFARAPRSKLLFTGRPELFLDDDELRRLLGVPGAATGPHRQLVWLSRFSHKQIGWALRRQPPHVRDEIRQLSLRNETFFDIVSRPSLLQQVSTIWDQPELQTRKATITSGLAIRIFLESSFRRQAEKVREDPKFKFMRLNESELAFFCRSVAAYMAAKGRSNQISAQELHIVVREVLRQLPKDFLFPARPDIREETGTLSERMKGIPDHVRMEEIVSNVRSYGVLSRDYAGTDTFQFSHKSYYELLCAEMAVSDLTRNWDIPGTAIARAFGLRFRSALVSPVVVGFVHDLWQTSRAGATKGGGILQLFYDGIFHSHGLARFIPRQISLLLFSGILNMISLWPRLCRVLGWAPRLFTAYIIFAMIMSFMFVLLSGFEMLVTSFIFATTVGSIVELGFLILFLILVSVSVWISSVASDFRRHLEFLDLAREMVGHDWTKNGGRLVGWYVKAVTRMARGVGYSVPRQL